METEDNIDNKIIQSIIIHTLNDLKEMAPLIKLEFDLEDQRERINNGEQDDTNEEGTLFQYTKEEYQQLLDEQNKLETTYQEAINDLKEKKEAIQAIRQLLTKMTN